MTKPGNQGDDLVTMLVTGPNTRWTEGVALAVVVLMLLSMNELRSGTFFVAAVIAIGAISLWMAIRGVLARPQARWYASILRRAGLIALGIAVLSSITAGLGAVFALLGL